MATIKTRSAPGLERFELGARLRLALEKVVRHDRGVGDEDVSPFDAGVHAGHEPV